MIAAVTLTIHARPYHRRTPANFRQRVADAYDTMCAARFYEKQGWRRAGNVVRARA